MNISSDEVRQSYGEHFDYQDDVYARRFTFRQNTMWINQVAGEHRFGRSDRLKIDWAGSMSTADANEPDRRQLVYLYPPGIGRTRIINSMPSTVWRTNDGTAHLNEEETSARAGTHLPHLGEGNGGRHTAHPLVRTGAQMKRKQRIFGYDIFSYDVGGVNANNPSRCGCRPSGHLHQQHHLPGKANSASEMSLGLKPTTTSSKTSTQPTSLQNSTWCRAK